MSNEYQINNLYQKHKELEEKLQKLNNQPAPKDEEINKIKREKLIVKDKIEKIKNNAA